VISNCGPYFLLGVLFCDLCISLFVIVLLVAAVLRLGLLRNVFCVLVAVVDCCGEFFMCCCVFLFCVCVCVCLWRLMLC